jgi:hypothetical protein
MANERRPTARALGFLYLAAMLPATINLVLLPRWFVVPGDAGATAERIAANPLLYRFCTLASFVNSTLFIVLVLALYRVLSDVDRAQARLMVAFVLTAAAISLVNLTNEIAPLVLLSGAEFLSAFSQEQLEAASLGFLRLRAAGIGLASAFWGLWLFPFGLLVIRSGHIPRFIGVLLIVGGVGYLAQSLVSLVFPALAPALMRVALPMVVPGELVMVTWLLARGKSAAWPGPERSTA